jgi:hypothetical protein
MKNTLFKKKTNSTEDSVENEINEYTLTDPKKTMINVTKVTPHKNMQKRNFGRYP